jgi:copper(I)-binding protein
MHWMLFQSQKPFRRGEVFSFELWIEGQPNIHFEAKVKDE